ncbi:disease resistance protein RUN1-like [Vitis riparia]|uniref:disease resistance protein RUN1-like n=1 Tax=Vitis riparia TaxID=96939 RepID=UPI00155A7746|nr:disease resistance protein RUN1-like [Vitis riparia]
MGEDTRHKFADHLYRALNQKGVRTFRDNEELGRGEEIAPELLKAIEESRICLIVLSENYARSKWYLDELAKIMDCRQKMGKLVFPIFYHVEPFRVRGQTGSYEEAFEMHEKNADQELLEKLNTIRLSSCQRLIEIPDISVSAPNLEKLTLDGCSNLVKVHPSIGKLRKLILLNLKNCKKLSSFPSIIDMEALEILNLSGCSELKKFPDIQGNMEHLLELYLASTAIEELPSSIEHLTGLVLLDLKRCKNLKSLPTSVCKLEYLEYLFSLVVRGLVLLNLRNFKNLASLPKGMCTLTSLETLIVSGCSQLNNLPKNLGSLQHLAQLHADGTAITQPSDSIKLDLSRNDFLSIPAGISELTSLKDLRLGQYQSLTEIPKLPPSVRDIHPHNCTALLPGSSSVSTLEGLQVLFYNCSKSVEDQSCGDKRNEMQRFPHNYVSSTASVSSLTTSPVLMQKLFENIAFSIVFPGSGIPEWIWHQSVGSSIKIELPTDWYNDDFLGFALCSVLEQLPERIICHFNSDVFYYGDLKDFGHDFHWKGNHVGAEHVWLGYQPCSQLRLFQFNDPNDWNPIEISFEAAHRFNSSASNVVKKCGVCLIYAEDLEGIHPGNRKQLKSRGCNVVERSSDRAGFNRSGMDSSYSGSNDRPTNHPTLKRKRPLE